MAKYGNLPLGQVYKLLISIIGRDAALAMVDEHNRPATEKNLDRTFNEEGRSFEHFRPSEKTSPMELIRKFFQLLEDLYGIPGIIKQLVIPRFFGVYRNALRSLIPYERQTKDIALHLLNWFLGFLGTKMQEAENPEKIYTVSKKSVERLLRETENYENIFDDILSNLQISKVDFYNETEKFYKGKPLGDFAQAIKRDITKCCKNNTNEPWVKDWYKFKAILDFLKSKNEYKLIKLIHRLIGLYLLKNAEVALKEICEIEKIDNIEKDIFLWAKNELPTEPQSESQCFLKVAGKYNPMDLSILQNAFIDPDFMEQKATIERIFLWGKTTVESNTTEQLVQAMEKECLSCHEKGCSNCTEEECSHWWMFFTNWARARQAILSYRFDNSGGEKNIIQDALKYYYTAFNKGKNFAGTYLKAFIEESIAATVYFDRKETKDIADAQDPNKNDKKPITDDVRQYYEYGYALNLFEPKSTETYFLHFHAEEHFWKVFSDSSFVYAEYAKERHRQDDLRANGMHQIEGGKEALEKYNESLKRKLANKKEGKINNRTDILPGHNVQYTPLSIALQRGELDIAEKYLNDFDDDTLNINKINTHGSTALEEALTQYKKHRLFEWDEQKAVRYKKIILEIIHRSSAKSLSAETVKSYVSVLEEAINAFDIDIVRDIVETKGFDIQDLKISADELSPLCYTINRCCIIKKILDCGKLSINGSENINWTKLNVPGIFTEDKIVNYQNMVSDPMFKKLEEYSYSLFCGKPEIREQELKELKDIVKYLIEKTNDVDAFSKETPSGIRTTALGLAVEAGFDDICQLLKQKSHKAN